MSIQKNSSASTDGGQGIELRDDPELLKMMIADSKRQSPLYHPGPYWAAKAMNAENEIRRCGIADFRGSTNLIGLSYADNLRIDIRNGYSHGLKRLARWVTSVYPLSRIFQAQVQWTEAYAKNSILYAQEILAMKEENRDLLARYRIPYSLLGDCLRKVTIDGQDYSIHYLNILDQHDKVASIIEFGAARSIFEIGGGFGTNVHLLLENYENIRKVLYLDIPPNLYVGTQYLRAFYGAAVSDYRAVRRMNSIRFSADDSLEILCIAPWQIE